MSAPKMDVHALDRAELRAFRAQLRDIHSLGVSIDRLLARDAAIVELIETLDCCERWFARHAPTASLITGDHAEHPMLTCIRAALAHVGGAS